MGQGKGCEEELAGFVRFPYKRKGPPSGREAGIFVSKFGCEVVPVRSAQCFSPRVNACLLKLEKGSTCEFVEHFSGAKIKRLSVLCFYCEKEVAEMGRKRKKLKGTVQKIIKPPSPGEPEKAQIDIDGAEDLYREIRVDNEVTGENGEKARLKQGAEVDVIVEADSSATLKRPE